VLLTISRFNRCEYCMAAHSMIADQMSRVPPAVTEAIRKGLAIPEPKLAALSVFTDTLLGTRGLPSKAWARVKTERHLQTSTKRALELYYRMWLETDFSAEVRSARVETPLLVIGGRQDLPGFQEEHLRRTFGAWYPNVDFNFITDAGHYPMQETPVYLASLVERFLEAHR